MLLLFTVLQLFSLVGAQWSQCPTITVAPAELDTVSIWTDGVVSRLGVAKPTETSTPSTVTASTASVAKCPAECSFPLSTYVTTVGTQSSFLHIQEPLSFLVPGYFTRFPSNETLRCVAYQGSCGATVPLYRHYRITAFGVQHAYSFSPDVGYQDFLMEGNPVCYFWPSGAAADPSADNLRNLPDSELVTLNYFDNQAVGSLRDHYATTLPSATGYTQLAPLGKVATNLSASCDEMISLVEMVDNQTGPFARLDHKLVVESRESNRLFEQYTPTGEKIYCVARPVCGASLPLWKMYDYINLDSVMSPTPTSTISTYLYPNAPLCYIWAMDYVSSGGAAIDSSVGPQVEDLATTENSLSSTMALDEGSTAASTESSEMGTSPLPEISSTMAEIDSTISQESTVFFEEGTTSLPFETSPQMGEISSTARFSEETTIFPAEISSMGTTELSGTMETSPEDTTIFNLETGETTVGVTEIASTPQQGSTAFNPPASLPTATVGPEATTVDLDGSTLGPEATVPSTVLFESTVGTPVLEATTLGDMTEGITDGIMTEGPTTIGGLETTAFIPLGTTEDGITVELGSTVAGLESTVPQVRTTAVEITLPVTTFAPGPTIQEFGSTVAGLESTVPLETVAMESTVAVVTTIAPGPTVPEIGSTVPISELGTTVAELGSTVPQLEATDVEITLPVTTIAPGPTAQEFESTVPISEFGTTVAGLESTVALETIAAESTPAVATTIAPGPIVPEFESTVPILDGSTVPQLETIAMESTVPPVTIPAGPSTTPMTWESLFSSMTTIPRILPTVADVTSAPMEITTGVDTVAGPTTAGLPFINITELTKTTADTVAIPTLGPETIPPSSEITVIPVLPETPALATTAAPIDSLIFTVPHLEEVINGGITVAGDVPGEITVTDSTGLVHNLIEKAVSLEQVIMSTALPIRDATDLFSLNG